MEELDATKNVEVQTVMQLTRSVAVLEENVRKINKHLNKEITRNADAHRRRDAMLGFLEELFIYSVLSILAFGVVVMLLSRAAPYLEFVNIRGWI